MDSSTVSWSKTLKNLRRTLGLAPEPDATTVESEAQRAVRAFIKLYTP